MERIEEVVLNLNICDVRLEQCEVESTRGEDGSEDEVELAVCKTK